MIIPNRIQDNAQIAPHPANAPKLFQGYYGWGDALFYMWLWGDLCQDQHIHLNDADLLAERGEMIGTFDTEGLNIEETTLFDEDLGIQNCLEKISLDLDFQNPDFFKKEEFGDNLSINSHNWFDIDGDFDLEGFDF